MNQIGKKRSKTRQYSIDNALPYTSEKVQTKIILCADIGDRN